MAMGAMTGIPKRMDFAWTRAPATSSLMMSFSLVASSLVPSLSCVPIINRA